MPLPSAPRILVIRRDNIGDLVCTTPLLAALRQRYPEGWIGVLANSYNAPVLAGNPHIDAVYTYTKAKHRAPSETLLGVMWRRFTLLLQLRRMHLDDIILAAPAAQPRLLALARWLKPKRIIAFGLTGSGANDVALPLATDDAHEVDTVFRIARLYGIDGPPPACCVAAPKGATLRDSNTIAVHVSARKPSQRWAAERFVTLMQNLHASQPALRFVLLWAPGRTDDPLHPGDDEKAAAIIAALGPDFPVQPTPTAGLDQLIAALAPCDAMICADGGAMHVAAGLGLPIVCLFGNSGLQRWRPWGVPQQVLQKPSLDVADISVEEVAAAFNALRDTSYENHINE
ncbi:MAG: glycosyltransferase family 9 protein [Rhodocyclaceae bacterium]|nr:MAG: glycosyltransferase family 9 protein [Rhodocyclaceae bacterium]